MMSCVKEQGPGPGHQYEEADGGGKATDGTGMDMSLVLVPSSDGPEDTMMMTKTR